MSDPRSLNEYLAAGWTTPNDLEALSRTDPEAGGRMAVVYPPNDPDEAHALVLLLDEDNGVIDTIWNDEGDQE